MYSENDSISDLPYLQPPISRLISPVCFTRRCQALNIFLQLKSNCIATRDQLLDQQHTYIIGFDCDVKINKLFY